MENLFSSKLLFGEEILNQMHLFWGTWLDYFMAFITFFGNEIFYTLAIPVLYWCYDKRKTIKIGSIFL